MKISTVLLTLSIITSSALATSNADVPENQVGNEKMVIINAPGSVLGIAVIEVKATIQKVDIRVITFNIDSISGRLRIDA